MTAFGISIPQDAVSGDRQLVRRFVLDADAAGYDSLWVSESTKPQVLDPMGVLHYSAALTERPQLGAAVLLSAFRAPVRLAREIATLDRLSG